MVQALGKIWGLGIFSIVFLTTSNIFLTLRLVTVSNDGNSCYRSASSRQPVETFYNQNHSAFAQFRSNEMPVDSSKLKMSVVSSNLGFLEVESALGRFDDTRQFRIFDNAFVGSEYIQQAKSSVVTLATQSSADRLFWLIQVSQYWNPGPISLALFCPEAEFGIAKAYLQYLVTCFPSVGQNLAVHIVYPNNRQPKLIDVNILEMLHKCDRPQETLRKLLVLRPKSMTEWRDTMKYPQNILRNVARKNCQTEWNFLTDIDIIPTSDSFLHLSEFLVSKQATSCSKCAFVVPTYEISEKVPMPHTKSRLLKLIKSGKAIPFHKKVFRYNQHATNFTKWEARESSFPDEKEVTISHTVTDFEFFYEPFYISKDNVPPHDERFLGYGFTRNTQVYEMYVAGYSFKVLSPIFVIHWGLQSRKKRPAWRERQNSLNHKLFAGFKREVFARYQKDPLGMMKDRHKRRPGG